MDRASHQFFASATFTGDQNIGAAGRDLLNQLVDFFDSPAFADDSFEVETPNRHP